MVKVSIEYSGELHCVATHGPSGRSLETDAPVDNHGRGESFSPSDLVGTALGACMATIMGIYARNHDLDLTGMKIEVSKELTQQGPRRIERLTTEIRFPAGVEKSEALERAALTCPVHRSLLAEIEKPVVFHYAS